jgi:quercetin dioxygenase-like cupin family protein
MALVIALAFASASPEKAVPVEEEPLHKTVFKNEWVQAFRVTLVPGGSTGMHIHAHDDAAVRLSTATTTDQKLGEPEGSPQTAAAGFVSARTLEGQPLTHRVHNVGTTTFDVVDVQALKRPDGPETAALFPPVAENPRLRAYRYELAPGAKSPVHTHERPYVIVAATDMGLGMSAPDGRSMSHPIKAGDLHFVNEKVTHALANEGKEPGIVVEIELR